ncbi:hypothetical protein J21TS7_26840 [Paenibacillus cineris]|uniref:Uncharacterized protein n=1 Tax=Paenibacillus cineris TaxID=237530 RepID=A0ABQ4LD61_9BACL|nr:hypothetical protein J21TS7_26840 [Paenibacillus cineris]
MLWLQNTTIIGDSSLARNLIFKTFQITKDGTIHFDDREVARNAIRERGSSPANIADRALGLGMTSS